MPIANVFTNAACQMFETLLIRTAERIVTITMRPGRMRPLPTDGNRCRKKSRSGRAWPRTIIHTTMAIAGSDWAAPVKWMNRSASVCMMPRTRPPTSASGKLRKPATSAAAIAARTTFVMTAIWSVTIGATKMPATPASAEPSAQLSAAIRSGDSPTDAAARWFSATAVVAMPNRLRL